MVQRPVSFIISARIQFESPATAAAGLTLISVAMEMCENDCNCRVRWSMSRGSSGGRGGSHDGDKKRN